jgi:hypothetical protein
MRRLSSFLLLGALALGTAAGAADTPVTHRLLAQDRGHAVILNEKGEVEWEAPVPFVTHDISMLRNGNLLVSTAADNVVEISPDKQVVWKHQAKPKAGYAGRVEIHGFQRLPNGNTLIAETGNLRLVEVDKDDQIVKEIPLTVEHPNSHRDTRLMRKLENGNYLVCHEGDGTVREYDPQGKVVWSYVLDLNGRPRSPGHGPEGHGTEVFGAIRLPNGNTMIAGGNNNRVFEVNREGKIVWSIDQKELPGITLAWVTTLEYLPNGHLIFGNTHAGPENPQLIEVTRDKKVVWTLKNRTVLGSDTVAAQVLDVKKVIR